MAYHVHLDNFEGPLDLLLYFIQRDKIDIYDIPIAHITAEYLSYLEVMEALNLAVAGEFVLLAATLMRIKARTLLPRPEVFDDALLEDPRDALVHQLVEYRRFKAASVTMGLLAARRNRHYVVGRDSVGGGDGVQPSDYLQDVTLFQLLAVVRNVMGRLPQEVALDMEAEPIRLDDTIRTIRLALAASGKVSFRQILTATRQVQEVVVVFLAVLEMMRRGGLVVMQSGPFGEIFLEGAPES